VPRVPFKAFRSRGADPKKALKERRPVFWEETKGFKKTPVYALEELKCGNIVRGPAIIEARDTTYVIHPKKQFKIDKFLNGIIEDV